MKKIVLLIVVLLIVLTVCLCSCTKSKVKVDTESDMRARINFNGEIYDVKVVDYEAYSGKDVLYLVLEDGSNIRVSGVNCILYRGKFPEKVK